MKKNNSCDFKQFILIWKYLSTFIIHFISQISYKKKKEYSKINQFPSYQQSLSIFKSVKQNYLNNLMINWSIFLQNICLSITRSRHFLPRRAFPTRRSLGTHCTRPRSPSAWTVSYSPSHVDLVSSLHTNREGRWETLVSASPSKASHWPADRKP